MPFDLLFQLLEPEQVVNALLVAAASILLRRFVGMILPAILSFLAHLAVLIALFLIFMAAMMTLLVLSPVP